MLCCRSCTATCTCRRFTGGSLAAVFGEESDQCVHRSVVGGIDDEATLLPASCEASAGQSREVEGQRRGWKLELFADRACGKTVPPCPDQQPEDRQAGILRESGEGLDCLRRFHVSRIMEMTAVVKPDGREEP